MSTSSTIAHTKDAVNLPVYLPSFYDEFRDFKLHPPTNSEARKLDKKDWITDELMEEIKNSVPSVDDIDKAKDNVRCQESFSKMVKKNFQLVKYSAVIFNSFKLLPSLLVFGLLKLLGLVVQYNAISANQHTKQNVALIKLEENQKNH